MRRLALAPPRQHFYMTQSSIISIMFFLEVHFVVIHAPYLCFQVQPQAASLPQEAPSQPAEGEGAVEDLLGDDDDYGELEQEEEQEAEVQQLPTLDQQQVEPTAGDRGRSSERAIGRESDGHRREAGDRRESEDRRSDRFERSYGEGRDTGYRGYRELDRDRRYNNDSHRGHAGGGGSYDGGREWDRGKDLDRRGSDRRDRGWPGDNQRDARPSFGGGRRGGRSRSRSRSRSPVRAPIIISPRLRSSVEGPPAKSSGISVLLDKALKASLGRSASGRVVDAQHQAVGEESVRGGVQGRGVSVFDRVAKVSSVARLASDDGDEIEASAPGPSRQEALHSNAAANRNSVFQRLGLGTPVDYTFRLPGSFFIGPLPYWPITQCK